MNRFSLIFRVLQASFIKLTLVSLAVLMIAPLKLKADFYDDPYRGLTGKISVDKYQFGIGTPIYPLRHSGLNPFFPKSEAISESDRSVLRRRVPGIPQAIGLSLIVPGAGQLYNGNWKRGLGFIAAEAMTIGAYFHWKGQGEDGRDIYIDYAHENWSPRKFAQWMNEYSGYGGPDIVMPSLSDEQFKNPSAWNEDQKVEVRRFFNDIREAESGSYYLSTGATFSHVLPYFAEQQYYELIGKYYQYAPGWSDYTAGADENPEEVIGDDLTTQFLFYDDIHGEANTFLRKASRVSGLLFTIHFVAAVEAAISAKIQSDRVKPLLSVVQGRNGEIVGTAGFVISL